MNMAMMVSSDSFWISGISSGDFALSATTVYLQPPNALDLDCVK